MNWLPKEQIKERSTSPRAALDVSLEKYEKCLQATADGLRRAIESKEVGFDNEWCGLCYFYPERTGTQQRCPLYVPCDIGCKCCTEYWTMTKAVEDWLEDNGSYSKVRAAIHAMCIRLYSERDKLPPEKEAKKEEPKKEDKRESRHGDYGYSNGGSPAITIKHYGGTYANRLLTACDDYEWQNLPEKECSQWLGKPNSIILGNIFTDLAAMGEPLKEFEMTETKETDSPPRKIKLCKGTDYICFKCGCENGHFHFTLDEAKKLALVLRRLVATAMKEQSSHKK